jgi:hypothetical protein
LDAQILIIALTTIVQTCRNNERAAFSVALERQLKYLNLGLYTANLNSHPSVPTHFWRYILLPIVLSSQQTNRPESSPSSRDQEKRHRNLNIVELPSHHQS